jgi:transglutaminase-like putative cysteine protease
MNYAIEHVTRFRYSIPVRESVMELRMRPPTTAQQRRLAFELSTAPQAQIISYEDHLGNQVDHFNIPGEHLRLTIRACARVEVGPPPDLPATLAGAAWQALDKLTQQGEHWEMLVPSTFAKPTELLGGLAHELKVHRRDDPLTLLRNLTTQLHHALAYAQEETKVDSPIEVALQKRRGVCQDFAHIMIALVRPLGIPCRYVSGYLYHQRKQDRSAANATHAWVEAYLPEVGWVGFDPTNNSLAGERHIRVAVGRDYADVPPTRGVFKGEAESELAVAVRVYSADSPEAAEGSLGQFSGIDNEDFTAIGSEAADVAQQQQQQ